MNEDFITRKEFEAYGGKCLAEHKRLEEENERQNHRLQNLEDEVEKIHDINASIREINVHMSNLLEEMRKQGKRLDELEKEPADSYRQIKMSIVTAVVSAVVGAVVGAVLVLL